MKYRSMISVFALALVSLVSFILVGQSGFILFDEWAQKVRRAAWPNKRDEGFDSNHPRRTRGLLPADSTEVNNDFDKVIRAEQSKTWLGRQGGPFAQKVQVSNTSQIVFHGDLHGDVHSPMAMIEFFNHVNIMNGFSIKPEYKDSFYIVFLGDYVKKGWYPQEVLYTLKRLKIANPENVFLLLGNNDSQVDQLPAVLYLAGPENGTNNVIQCNHGGIDSSYNPKRLLNTSSKQAFEKITFPGSWLNLGFVRQFIDPTGTGRSMGAFKTPTKNQIESYLRNASTAQNRIRGIFRAHQHSASNRKERFPLMRMMVENSKWQEGPENRGIARLWRPSGHTDRTRLWDGIVTTLVVSPLNITGPVWPYWYDTFVVLTLAKKFEDWRMYAIHTEPTERADTTKRFPDTQKYLNVVKQPRSAVAQDPALIVFERLSYELQALGQLRTSS